MLKNERLTDGNARLSFTKKGKIYYLMYNDCKTSITTDYKNADIWEIETMENQNKFCLKNSYGHLGFMSNGTCRWQFLDQSKCMDYAVEPGYWFSYVKISPDKFYLKSLYNDKYIYIDRDGDIIFVKHSCDATIFTIRYITKENKISDNNIYEKRSIAVNVDYKPNIEDEKHITIGEPNKIFFFKYILPENEEIYDFRTGWSISVRPYDGDMFDVCVGGKNSKSFLLTIKAKYDKPKTSYQFFIDIHVIKVKTINI